MSNKTGDGVLNPWNDGPVYIYDQKLMITVPADGLAPNAARPSAATVMSEKLDLFSFAFYWLSVVLFPFKNGPKYLVNSGGTLSINPGYSDLFVIKLHMFLLFYIIPWYFIIPLFHIIPGYYLCFHIISWYWYNLARRKCVIMKWRCC